MEPIRLIVGLGNPGSEYAGTRHNAGFWFADSLCERHGGRFTGNRRLQAQIADLIVGEHAVKVLKPQTYMNLSGESVAAALRYFRLPPEAMLVGYDEIDFEPGKVRLRFDGGHAGHNGIRNIISHVGAGFWRMRFGVGHPGDSTRVKGHVLRRASGDDEVLIREAIARGLESVEVLLRDGPERAQQQLHTEPGSGD